MEQKQSLDEFLISNNIELINISYGFRELAKKFLFEELNTTYEEDWEVMEKECYQHFLVSEFGYSEMERETELPLFYCADLDFYVLWIPFLWTMWTDIYDY